MVSPALPGASAGCARRQHRRPVNRKRRLLPTARLSVPPTQPARGLTPAAAARVAQAARFGATIVPFAAIGADEAAERLLDGQDLAQLPIIGDAVRMQQQRASARIPAARRGVNATMDAGNESFTQQALLAPLPPPRHYFVFRKPISTSPDMAADRAGCQDLYQHIKCEVEDGMGYLLRKRESDPYRELLPRLLFEAASGKQAPAFKP